MKLSMDRFMALFMVLSALALGLIAMSYRYGSQWLADVVFVVYGVAALLSTAIWLWKQDDG